MVGLIQKLMLDFIIEKGGEEKLNEIKRLANIPLDRTFQINMVYSDEEWQRLFAAAQKVLNLTEEQAEEGYSEYFCRDSVKRFPTWFQMCKNAYEFLSIQPTIHNCFATSVLDAKSREAINDKFRVEQLPNKLVTHYRSPNHHCGLYKALANRVLEHYKEKATIEETKCMKSGSDECEIVIQWPSNGA